MFTIGIAGGSGSGKSTLVDQLLRLDLGPHDAYYRNWADMPVSVRSANNWDHPDALDTTLYVADVVVPWESHNEPAVSLLAARVREHIPDDDLSGKAV